MSKKNNKKYEGFVLEMGEDWIIARLVDTAKVEPDTEGYFTLEDFAEDERGLIKEGSYFHVYAGFLDTPFGRMSYAIVTILKGYGESRQNS